MSSNANMWINIGMVIGISTGITLLIFSLLLFSYNFMNNQPLFSIPWLTENYMLKIKLSNNISELQNQITKLSEFSNVDINYVKNITIPNVQQILENSIADLKVLNTNSNTEIQTQIDKVNVLLVSLQKSITDSQNSTKTELQKQITELSENLQDKIVKSQESLEEKMKNQITEFNKLFNSENEEIKTKIIPSLKETMEILIDQKIKQNTDEIVLRDLNKLKDDIQTQIDKQNLNINEIKNLINEQVNILKKKTETENLIINTYSNKGEIIHWSVKGDDKGNLCIGDNKNSFCIDKDTGFLFNKNKTEIKISPIELPTLTELPSELPTELPTELPIELPTELPIELPTELPTEPVLF